MIVGMLLKNYKTYYGLKYIPVSSGSKFTSYIGDNGVGKSSVLEVLDSYFNNKEWNINNESKQRARTGSNIPHITLVFLIEKNKLIKDKNNEEIVEKLNTFLWNLDEKDFPKSKEAQKLILDIKSINENYKDTHCLMISGVRYEHNNEIFFSSFEDKIADLFELKFNIADDTEDKKRENESLFRKYFATYNEYVKQHYSYIYIPVEVSIENLTKLETTDMQKLMGKDIRTGIKSAIGETTRKSINSNLDKFIKDIESELGKYSYKNIKGRTTISMNELVDKVIELFFSIRTLHKKDTPRDIPVHELSSGEKRQAIIDISEAFLSTQKNYDKEIILAIDEPEASLNISKNYNQFEKLIELSKTNAQVLITTHWYGFLPIVTNGIAHFLNLSKDVIEIDSFDLYNYREKLKQLRSKDYKSMPDDIALKSLNDLIQSILSSIKLEKPYNWLICEGSSEKIYFDYYFKDLIKENNLRILPVGGASEVKKIYEYLELPLRDKEYKINGKIYCLIDTDSQSIDFKINKHSNLEACRLLNKNKHTELVKTDSKEYTPPTEIEDCLNGNIFIETLKSFNDEEINKILNNEKNIKDIALNSHYCLSLRPEDKECIKDFFDKNEGYRKIEFANKYIELCEKEEHELDWVEKIKKYFKDS